MVFAPESLPNALAVGFGVKLGIRQHHPEGSAACRHIKQPRQSAVPSMSTEPKCCKQKPYAPVKTFKGNPYKKHGRGEGLSWPFSPNV
jgi:hypothetical protein